MNEMKLPWHIVVVVCVLFFVLPLRAQTNFNATGAGNTYEVISAALGGSPYEVPDCAHTNGFGRHITDAWDAELGKFVFVFHLHVVPDGDLCTAVDRQRNEIKTYGPSKSYVKGFYGDVCSYRWKFKLDANFQPSPNFCHIHQIKAGDGSDDGSPLMTITPRYASPQRLELIYTAPTGLSGSGTKTTAPLANFKGQWIEASERVLYATNGTYEITLRRVSDGVVLLSYTNNNINMWRGDSTFIRPKWGIYRSLNSPSYLRDEQVRFADFCLAKGNDFCVSTVGTPPAFTVSAAPASQIVAPGGSANYTVNAAFVAGFTNSVAFSVIGLPANVAANFNPAAVTNTASPILTLTTSHNTPLGNYPLTVRGSGGGQTNTGTATLIVSSNTFAQPGTLVWTALAGAEKSWNPPLNWTNLASGGTGTPSPDNDILFTNLGAVGTISLSNNLVDAAFTGLGGVIRSLQFANTSNLYHTTFIAPGQTLVISNNTTGRVLLAGTGADNGTNAAAAVTAAITGANGELDLIAPNGFFSVSQGSATGSVTTPGAHRPTLDLSGLGALNVTVSNLFVGALGGSAGITRACGVLYLARENTITVLGGGTNGIVIADNGSGNGSALASGIYLGRLNAIFADAVFIGRQKAQNGAFLVFNPAFTNSNPEAVIRGTSDDRVSLYAVGDASLLNTTQHSLGTNDFTGGSVDLLADTMILGRGALSSGTATGSGIFIFTSGTVDVNTLEAGYQNGASSPVVGILNVNGANAALTVNHTLRLARANGGSAQGTLNIIGGSATVSNLVAGGGTSSVTLNDGTLTLMGAAGSPGIPLTTFSATNSTFHLNLNGSAGITNIVTSALSAGGLNRIAIDSVSNVNAMQTLPLISYATFNGSVANNFMLASLPSSFSAVLVDNVAAKRIDLRLAPSALVTPKFSGTMLAGTNFALGGSNGLPGGRYYLLTSTNLMFPLSNWSVVATNWFNSGGGFLFTNPMVPGMPQQYFLLQVP
jgi:hypothetical protein